jgi:4-amino-4-deoxy-L-arabinose transferase-like glycosyltransferase
MVPELKATVLLKIIIACSFTARILFVLLFININEINYYEYGRIAKNLHEGKGYSLQHFIYENTNDPNPSTNIYKSAYMPPGYVYFLYPFFYISNTILRYILILISQTMISCVLILFIYNFTKRYFSEWSALVAAAITGFLPEFIFASTQIQVTLLYQTGIILLLFLLYKAVDEPNRISTFIFIGITFGIIVLLRFEVILFSIIIAVFFAQKKKIRESLIIISIVFLFILPWQIRNYVVFEKVIPLTTSSGLNFYRGHNPYSIGFWGDDKLLTELQSMRKYKDYEVRMNEVYWKSALSSIKENPEEEIIYPFTKLFDLWIFNPSDTRTNNFLYLFPWFLILLFSMYGLIISFSWKDHKFSYLFLIFFNIVTVIFFALPRYQTMMKIALIPFAAFGLEKLIRKLKKETSK